MKLVYTTIKLTALRCAAEPNASILDLKLQLRGVLQSYCLRSTGRAPDTAPQDWDLAALPQQLLLQVVKLLVAQDGHLVEVERLRSSRQIVSI